MFSYVVLLYLVLKFVSTILILPYLDFAFFILIFFIIVSECNQFFLPFCLDGFLARVRTDLGQVFLC